VAKNTSDGLSTSLLATPVQIARATSSFDLVQPHLSGHDSTTVDVDRLSADEASGSGRGQEDVSWSELRWLSRR